MADLRAAAVGSAIARYERPCDLEQWLRGAADFTKKGEQMPEPTMTFRAALGKPTVKGDAIELSLIAKMPAPPAAPAPPLLLLIADADDRANHDPQYYRLTRQYEVEDPGTFEQWADDPDNYEIQDLDQEDDEDDAKFKKRIDGYKTKYQAAVDKHAKFDEAVAEAREEYADVLERHQAKVMQMGDEYRAYGSLAAMGALLGGQEFEVTLRPVASSGGQLPGFTAALMLSGPPQDVTSHVGESGAQPAARKTAARRR